MDKQIGKVKIFCLATITLLKYSVIHYKARYVASYIPFLNGEMR